MSKLKINIDKLKNKFKLFKNNRFKALLGATLIAATLSSCNTNTNSDNNKNSSNSYVQTIDEKEDFFSFNINFNNYNDEIKNNELITVYNNKNNITNTISIRKDSINTVLSTNTTKLYFNYLDKEVTIPNIDENEKLIVNVDYATKEISTDVENINTKTK